ncbi:unannotated protein [freshwater metagenome]|uniref:Unannotated protein n=1 Tax=freshwater metagenome TaxID=449393 RepID=A0A6J7KK04_9ZZZZ
MTSSSEDRSDPAGDAEPSVEQGRAGIRPPVSEAHHDRELHERLERIEQLLDPEKLVRAAERDIVEPAWKRITKGEPRWSVTLAVIVAIVLQYVLPATLTPRPRWLLPLLELAVLVALFVANPGRIDRLSRSIRTATIVLIVLASIANASSAARLVWTIIDGRDGQDATALLGTAAAIWLTNVIVFSLWYWELDRGGPAARAHGVHDRPDFVFAQMLAPEVAGADWEPTYTDYLYLSFTNATAFSPTDTMPFVTWAKLTMMLQSSVSLVTLVVVISRAVGLLN